MFSCALQLWKEKKKLDADEVNTSLMKYFKPNGDSNKTGREVGHVTDGKSFAQVMKIESMSRCTYESEAKEGRSQERDVDGQQLQ